MTMETQANKSGELQMKRGKKKREKRMMCRLNKE